MRKYFNRRRIGRLLVLLFFVELAGIFVHPFGGVQALSANRPLMRTANIEQPVLQVIERSCQNCHSDRTSWPWYSHIAPVSWLIQRDVHDGRSHWNMSNWDRYSLDQQQDILSQMAPMVRNRKMPLPQYLLLHPEAKLADSDIDLLYRWSRGERKRIKSDASQPSGSLK
jgi:cytochrome c